MILKILFSNDKDIWKVFQRKFSLIFSSLRTKLTQIMSFSAGKLFFGLIPERMMHKREKRVAE